jgi:hypothetical protein
MKKWFRGQKFVLLCTPTTVFGMGDVRQRNYAKPTPNLSFVPKVVDWACSLQKNEEMVPVAKTRAFMHP